MMSTTTTTMAGWAWRCQECGHAFRSAKAAERAYYDQGCPRCGGADIDLSLPVARPAQESRP